MGKSSQDPRAFEEAIENAFAALTYREREVIKLRYGIGDGYSYTIEEVARIFRTTPSTIGRVEAKAIRKLQSPSSARYLEVFLQEVDPDEAESRRIETQEVVAQAKEVTLELVRHLRDHHQDLVKLPWQVFENLVGECLASRGFDSIKMVGRNSETAADIFAVEKLESTGTRLRYFIETKRWKDRVGVEVIDRVYGAMLNERASWGWHLAMIVSVVGFKSFRKYTRNELELMGVELRDRDDIVKWLRDYRPSDRGLWLPPQFTLEDTASRKPGGAGASVAS